MKVIGVNMSSGRRFIVVDDDDCVLDDAQGFGYTSAEKAHRAWAYKSNKKARKRTDRRRRWWKRHEQFSSECDAVDVELEKSRQRGESFTEKDRFEAYRDIAKSLGIDDFTEDLMHDRR